MRAVNLLPANAYAPKQRLPHAPVVLAATVPVLVGACVYLGYSFEHSKVVDRQSTLGVVQSQIAALGPSPQLVSEASRVASERQSRIAALNDVLGKQVPWDVVLDRLSRVLPAGSWLTALSAMSPTPSGAVSTTSHTNPTSVTIQGFAYSHDGVAQVLSRLALVPGLENVALGSTTTSTINNKTVIQFNLTASIGATS
ncbi:MAG TPA: PilN domain-containing protein [Gaiellaceae bacterium]|jgi:Tfp pilus assembly protein PilN